MTDIEEKFLIVGLQPLRLACNLADPQGDRYGDCEWDLPIATGTTVAQLSQQMYQHAVTNHGHRPEDPPCCKRYGCAHPPIPHDRLEKPTEEAKREIRDYRLGEAQQFNSQGLTREEAEAEFAYPPGVDKDAYDAQSYLEGDTATATAAARRLDDRAGKPLTRTDDMHSFEAPSGATYYHNDDFSGDVEITLNQDTVLGIPFEDIRALYLESLRRSKISALEQASYDSLEEAARRGL